MKYILLILILLLSSTCFANEITSVRQVSDYNGYLLSKSYIPSLKNYEAGYQGAANSMHNIFNADYYTKYYNGTEDIFYADEFKYGGRYDLITYYWNPPATESIPEPCSILILGCGGCVMFTRRTRQNRS